MYRTAESPRPIPMYAALLGISFFLLVLLAEKVVVHRAPEHLV